MKRRKHRIVVEVTYSKPVTAKDAASGLGLTLEKLDFDKDPVWVVHDIYIDKIARPKEFSRVHRAEMLKVARDA